MVQPLLLQYYQLLPHQPVDDNPANWTRGFRKGLGKFKRSVEARYNEASLERLLHSGDTEVRQGGVLALGMLGSMKVNGSLAHRLHDDDPAVSSMAADALWSIWFRAETPENNDELQRLMALDADDIGTSLILAGFEQLIRKAPRFAEAFNQRAVFHFRNGDYARSILDCEKTLRVNPYHFGAASGMGQCFMKQKKLRAALRIYRRANRINPRLDGVKQVIESLERMLGEEGKR